MAINVALRLILTVARGLECRLNMLSSGSYTMVHAGSALRGGDVTVYVIDVNQPSLPTLFILFLCLFLSLWPFNLYFIP